MRVLTNIIILLCINSGCRTDSAPKNDQIVANKTAASTGATTLQQLKLKDRDFAELGISIAVPEHWTVAPYVEENQKLWAIKQPCPDTVKFCTNYVINVTPQQKNLPRRNYGDFLIASLRAKYSQFKLISRSDEFVNTYPSITIDYIFLEQGLNLGGTTTFFFFNGKVVVVNFGALNEPEGEYVNHRGLYTRILTTLKPLR